MGKVSKCTLTGVDESTDLGDLEQLSAEFPIVEWGILYSPKRQGQPGRYPSARKIASFLNELPMSMSLSLHICGSGVTDFIKGEAIVEMLVKLVGLRNGRVQLNFNALEDGIDMAALIKRMQENPDVDFITQVNENNLLIGDLLSHVPNHGFLIDSSLGSGKSPESWPVLPEKYSGYAGGLGPDNVASELEKITVISAKDFWIDMEGKLRTDDAFDLTKARAVLQAVEPFCLNPARRKGRLSGHA